ncbi:unnamed protein product [Mytilus coruscus]|uniref:G-protein coupled receptors family 1 profile domain-containing protein n=1 Tax=Mytilus coruscus TaxID=42192 RepID=A0A6J8CV43_MYTCO|nr:unnamed protein product [Mytilus coruscus]
MENYNFLVDGDRHLLFMLTSGSVISYVSMLLNIVVFIILCRKALLSPATILMQGLAVADVLTAFSTYGFEPLFLPRYDCDRDNNTTLTYCHLQLPYCAMAIHLSILSATFHTASYLITTCLGIQKVIALLFPFWTKCYLTNTKSAMCCAFCFLLSITTGFPRHFVLGFGDDSECFVYPKYNDILEYASCYYLMIQTVLLTCCCFLMLMSTIYVTYKLFTNKFRGRMTERKRQERNSIIMIAIVLLVFISTEVPKVFCYFWWCRTYHRGEFIDDEVAFCVRLLFKYEDAMAWILTITTDAISGSWGYRLTTFTFLMKGIQLFMLVGCLSNFIIYIVMSSKMRNEIKSMLNKPTNCNHQTNQRKRYEIQ